MVRVECPTVMILLMRFQYGCCPRERHCERCDKVARENLRSTSCSPSRACAVVERSRGIALADNATEVVACECSCRNLCDRKSYHSRYCLRVLVERLVRPLLTIIRTVPRSEERRVGKECRSRWS